MVAYPASRSDAVERIRSLATRLRDPSQRAVARAELDQLARAAHDAPDTAPLRATVIDACVGTRQERLELLLLPSIFEPEAWAFTFLEGLFKVPLEEYTGRCLIELGTGSGWICIALAKLTDLAYVAGVDLNPHSAPLAECNAWLNGLCPGDGRLELATSDLLLQVSPERRFDFVIGCIPQVLRADASPPTEEDERALYDLSNYCAIQNVYEDHFGLGLIARLLDEVPERLAPRGRVLLNLAGRPGRPIIERMFTRRGMRTEVKFAQRVPQASDTDIGPLVQLERQTGRDFEFFLDAHSAKPVCAATAAGWLASGHPIWHEVAVWEGRLRLPRETLGLRQAVRDLGVEGVLAQLDLCATSSEQLSFVIELARRLSEDPRLPYAELGGGERLRGEVARYLERFFGLNLDPQAIFVGPERQQTVYSLLLATCDPGDAVLVSRNLVETFAPAIEKARVRAVVGNDTLHETERLLEGFDVRVVLLAVEPEERSNLGDLRAIVLAATRRGIWVVLDESAYLTITSDVEPHTLFEFLAREPAHPNLVVLYGLIKNAVSPDFELTLALPVSASLRTALDVAGELTYSRISRLVEIFYEQLFAELLSFRVSFSAPEAPSPRPESPIPLPCSARIRELAQRPGLGPPCFDPADPERIRLDYGENESPVPSVLIEGLAIGCVTDADAPAPALAEAVTAYLLETRGLRYAPGEIVLGPGVWPLVHDLARVLCERLERPPRIAVLTPCYGLLPPALTSAGAEVLALPARSPLELASLERPDAILICQPQNPTGTYMPRELLLEIASYAVEQRCWLISDEIFGLLNLTDPSAETVPSPAALESVVPGVGARTLVLGGLSKELAAGGLRVGWLATRDPELARALRRVALGPVQRASAHAATHLYAAYARGPGGRLQHPERQRELRAYLAEMRRDLARKRALLEAALPSAPDDPRGTLGGLFVAPAIDAWLGSRADGVVLTPENVARVLYEHTHVVVNDGAWCRDPRRIRAVYALPEDRLQRAVERLRSFAAQLTKDETALD